MVKQGHAGGAAETDNDTGTAPVRSSSLVAAMRRMAVWIEPRSRKVSDTLRVSRMTASTALAGHVCLPTAAAQLDQHGNKIQPASTPDGARLETG